MLGLVALVALWSALVAVNQRNDRGALERRKLDRLYGWLLVEMGEFEAAGGRVHELSDAAAAVRRQLRRTWLGPFALAAVAVALQVVLGFAPWIVAAALAGFVFVSGALTWGVAGIFGITDAEGSKTRAHSLALLGATVVKAFLVGAGVLTAYAGVAAVNRGAWARGLGLDLAAYLLVTYCYLPALWVDRLSRRGRVVDFAQGTGADSILFLRSFADDDFRLFTPMASFGPRFRFVPGRRRFEEFLATALHNSGRLVAIGRPDEKLPALGAARSYWSHDDWQAAMQATASRSRAIMAMAGRTDSLAWEMQQLNELRVTRKSLILFPPDGEEGTLERHRTIVDALGVPDHLRLPDVLAVSLLAMTFDDTGRPIYYTACGRDWSAYTATVMHHAITLRGHLRHEDDRSIRRTIANVEDPFHQAAYDLGGHRGRRAARATLASAAASLDDTPATIVGWAWAQLEIDKDPAGARRILLGAADEHPADELIRRALDTLADIEAGRSRPRALLHAPQPVDAPDLAHTLVHGHSKLSLHARALFSRAMVASAAKWEGWDADEALKLVEQARRLAAADDQKTAVAAADVWAADALLHLGRLDEARERFSQVSRLTRAPRTEVAVGLPFLDPRHLVDDALVGLRTIAARGDDEASTVEAAKRVRDFRAEVGFAEGAAHATSWLAEHHLQRGEPTESVPWGRLAATEYEELGLKLPYADTAVQLAVALNHVQTHAEARTWAERAAAAADVVEDPDLGSRARFELARADAGLGSSQDAATGFAAVFTSNLERHPSWARASMIRLGELDPVAAAPLAHAAANADLTFYGPEATARLVAAADAAPDDELAATWRAAAVDIALRCLTDDDIEPGDAQRCWRLVADAVISAPDDQPAALVEAVGAGVPRLSRAAAREAWGLLYHLNKASRHATAGALGRPVDERLSDLMSREATPLDIHRRVLALAQWRYGLRYGGRREDAVSVGAELVALARTDGTDAKAHHSLAMHLVKHGHDLAHADRTAEAVAAYAEAADLLEPLAAADEDCRALLCEALTSWGESARGGGDHTTATAAFARSQAVIDAEPSADWAARAQRLLDQAQAAPTP